MKSPFSECNLMSFRRLGLVVALLVCVSRPALAQPGVATLIAPSSDVFGNTIVFSWQSSENATWYQFWLGKADTTELMDHWYTADAAGCTVGGVCTITLSAPIKAAGYVWYIRAWNAGGYANWSLPTNFTVKEMTQAWTGKLPPSRRFSLVLDNQAVLDNETGLVWQRTPFHNTVDWWNVYSGCYTMTTGGRSGWRQPTIEELLSLVETIPPSPRLPAGHPFVLPPAPLTFWSRTPHVANYFYADFTSGTAFAQDPNSSHKAWCVRGPQ
jgi:hypothetical protein